MESHPAESRFPPSRASHLCCRSWPQLCVSLALALCEHGLSQEKGCIKDDFLQQPLGGFPGMTDRAQRNPPTPDADRPTRKNPAQKLSLTLTNDLVRY